MSFLGLEDRHVLVTGASGGIGQALVKQFLGDLYKTHNSNSPLTLPLQRHSVE